MVTVSVKSLFLILLVLKINALKYPYYSRPVSWPGLNRVPASALPSQFSRYCVWQNQWIDCSLLNDLQVNAMRDVNGNFRNTNDWFRDQHDFSQALVPNTYFHNNLRRINSKFDWNNLFLVHNMRENQQAMQHSTLAPTYLSSEQNFDVLAHQSVENSNKDFVDVTKFNNEKVEKDLNKTKEVITEETINLESTTTGSTESYDTYINTCITSTTMERQQQFPVTAQDNNYNVTDNPIYNNASKLIEKDELNTKCTITLFTRVLNRLQKYLHLSIFKRLSAISPSGRSENGVSFTHSSIFLLLNLMAITKEVDSVVRAEIIQSLGLNTSCTDSLNLVKNVISLLPVSSDDLKFPWVSRLILKPEIKLSDIFRDDVAPATKLHLKTMNGNETAEELCIELNDLVDVDSAGAMHDGFEEEDLTEGVRTILLTTLCLRPTWRTAPTLLNGSWPFNDSPETPKRSARMIRINDIMRYSDLSEFNAQAVEINYATPGLSILIIIPRGSSLRQLMIDLATVDLDNITNNMQTMRIAVSLPIFTIRMTLLLPNKLEDLGFSQLVNWTKTPVDTLRVSHAVQRLMFWSEPGRHAFKDDGIEWDESPELEMLVNRPYVFYVRWHNLTLLNGNFVL